MELIKSVLMVIAVLVMFVAILYLAYVTTKFIGKRYIVKGKQFKNLTVIETVAIGPDRQLMIVKSAGKCLLLGATPQNISLITELDEEMIKDIPDEMTSETMSFSDALRRVTKEKLGKKNQTEETYNAEES
ncbi:MAG: hypothetical protein E7509_02420 [Ruminococcus sp.]|nr:hypothetical protein [Ruminococcus sp.]